MQIELNNKNIEIADKMINKNFIYDVPYVEKYKFATTQALKMFTILNVVNNNSKDNIYISIGHNKVHSKNCLSSTTSNRLKDCTINYIEIESEKREVHYKKDQLNTYSDWNEPLLKFDFNELIQTSINTLENASTSDNGRYIFKFSNKKYEKAAILGLEYLTSDFNFKKYNIKNDSINDFLISAGYAFYNICCNGNFRKIYIPFNDENKRLLKFSKPFQKFDNVEYHHFMTNGPYYE